MILFYLCIKKNGKLFIKSSNILKKKDLLTKQRLKTPVLFGRQWDTHV